MTFLILAFLAGLFTIATPCILPVLPFVLARSETPFRRGALPMLIGLAVTFAGVATLASVAGGWAVAANHTGRVIALSLLAVFGLALMWPGLATRLAAPLVALGNHLVDRAGREGDTTIASSVLLGVATGFVWAPCAGPVLGLILTTAALHGPGLQTSLLLLAYGLGAATALAAGLWGSARVLKATQISTHWGEKARGLLGLAVVTGAGTIALGFDQTLLTSLSSPLTNMVERKLVDALNSETGFAVSSAKAETIAAADAPLAGPLAAVLDAQQWLNTKPLRPADLRGKVVLVNFWTYSCINCLRVLPHVRAWAEAYKDQGLVVIGVHTPEFAFEKNATNVTTALAALGVTYPVAIDNDFGIWQAFNNEAWPALYFIGADGRIRHTVLGEGEYDQSEEVIKQLLAETRGNAIIAPKMDTEKLAASIGTGTQAATNGADFGSPETYLGYGEGSHFRSADGVVADQPHLYTVAANLPLNWWSLNGTWTIGKEFATVNDPQGSISYRFHARDLHLILAPGKAEGVADHSIRFRVTIDGQAPGADHGTDIDADGWGEVTTSRLYQLVRQQNEVTDHIFKIEFFEAGARAYTFTFG